MKLKERSRCRKCEYYHEINNTCQMKKCSGTGHGYVTLFDKLWCKFKA